jgi:hypothetical protein
VTQTQDKVRNADAARERTRIELLSHVGEVRDTLQADCSDEVFAHRLQASLKAIDVLIAGIDALYANAGQAEQSTRLLGAKASAETNGEDVEDANVASRVGERKGATQLPDVDERLIRDDPDFQYIPPGTVASVQAGREPAPTKD